MIIMNGWVDDGGSCWKEGGDGTKCESWTWTKLVTQTTRSCEATTLTTHPDGHALEGDKRVSFPVNNTVVIIIES
jgi:hypothetical protein